jgi:glycosyltransferase involved in cell wall biosynthesis
VSRCSVSWPLSRAFTARDSSLLIVLTVAIDAEHTRQSAAGIARYARGLTAALRERDDLRVIELGGGDVVPRGTLRKKFVTARQDFLWYPWLARSKARSVSADVYHSPLPRGPLTRGHPPFVVTVHDLAQIHYAETTTRWSRMYAAVTLRRVIDAADRIIVPSLDTAADISSSLKISPERIRVVMPGVDPIFLRALPSQPVVARPYVLFVGTPEPRKNLPRLIEAMRLLRARGFAERLVIAGSGGWGNVSLESENVDQLGRVSDEQLAALYAHASCLAIPSLHEGFGLPAIEAMACGIPVVAGRSGALPEITGGAAVLVDPLSSASIADGIEQTIKDRDPLIARGRVRVTSFGWKRAAAETAAIYHELR